MAAADDEEGLPGEDALLIEEPGRPLLLCAGGSGALLLPVHPGAGDRPKAGGARREGGDDFVDDRAVLIPHRIEQNSLFAAAEHAVGLGSALFHQVQMPQERGRARRPEQGSRLLDQVILQLAAADGAGEPPLRIRRHPEAGLARGGAAGTGDDEQDDGSIRSVHKTPEFNGLHMILPSQGCSMICKRDSAGCLAGMQGHEQSLMGHGRDIGQLEAGAGGAQGIEQGEPAADAVHEGGFANGLAVEGPVSPF